MSLKICNTLSLCILLQKALIFKKMQKEIDCISQRMSSSQYSHADIDQAANQRHVAADVHGSAFNTIDPNPPCQHQRLEPDPRTAATDTATAITDAAAAAAARRPSFLQREEPAAYKLFRRSNTGSPPKRKFGKPRPEL